MTRPAWGEPKPRIDVVPGRTYRFYGREALAYVRSRKDSSDYTRMARQRCFLSALADQLDPVRVLRNFGSLAKTVETNVHTDIPLNRLPTLVRLVEQGRAEADADGHVRLRLLLRPPEGRQLPRAEARPDPDDRAPGDPRTRSCCGRAGKATDDRSELLTGLLRRVPAWAFLTALIALSTVAPVARGMARRRAVDRARRDHLHAARPLVVAERRALDPRRRHGLLHAALSASGGPAARHGRPRDRPPDLAGPAGARDVGDGRAGLPLGAAADEPTLGARGRGADTDAALARLCGARDERDALPALGDGRALGARPRARAADRRTPTRARRCRRSCRHNAAASSRLRARRRHVGGRQGAARPRPRGPTTIRADVGGTWRGGRPVSPWSPAPVRSARMPWLPKGRTTRVLCCGSSAITRSGSWCWQGSCRRWRFRFRPSQLSAAARLRPLSEPSWRWCSPTCRGSQSRWACLPHARSTTSRAAIC